MALSNPRFSGQPTLEAAFDGSYRILSGEQDTDAVARIQSALIDLGYKLPVRGADGVFAGETGTAVVNFKTDRGIFPNDPVVGRKTMTALDNETLLLPHPVPIEPVGRTRQNVFALGDVWSETILWYARAVQQLKGKALQDPTSWRFYAAIHGYSQELWNFYGVAQANEFRPTQALQDLYWDQCQHQSWHFLPWHRGYLLSIENLLRNEIKLLNGPHETWALPYWNYFGAGQNHLPFAFQTPDWPDGQGDNPLYVVERWGDLAKAAPFSFPAGINLTALREPEFTGVPNGSSGFGGPITGFSWAGNTSGGLENNPHNSVHVFLGGQHPNQLLPASLRGGPKGGLMSHPNLAALDPIFYLHHCNIDRLWQSWNFFPAGKPSTLANAWQNPTDQSWLDGPAAAGERRFAMPNPDGSEWSYTPQQMVSIDSLGYHYDDLNPGLNVPPPISLNERLERLGIPTGAAEGRRLALGANSQTELIAASNVNLQLSGDELQEIVVDIVPSALRRVIDSFASVNDTLPDRIFLRLENITGFSDATTFQVYLGLADGILNRESDENLVGAFSLFGITQASDPNGEHAASGLNFSFEITDIIDQIYASRLLNVDQILTYIAPVAAIPPTSRINIGRISVYRQFEQN